MQNQRLKLGQNSVSVWRKLNLNSVLIYRMCWRSQLHELPAWQQQKIWIYKKKEIKIDKLQIKCKSKQDLSAEEKERESEKKYK